MLLVPKYLQWLMLVLWWVEQRSRDDLIEEVVGPLPAVKLLVVVKDLAVNQGVVEVVVMMVVVGMEGLIMLVVME